MTSRKKNGGYSSTAAVLDFVAISMSFTALVISFIALLSK